MKWPLLLTLAWLLLPWLACADTHRWDGTTSAFWNTGANWDTGIVPTDGDDLVFPAGPTRLATTNNTSTTRRFNSITISGANYALRGNSLTLSNGITATCGAGSSASVELDITLARSQEIECTTDNSILYVTGDLALGANTLTGNGAGNVLLGGALSGTGGVTKNGTGNLRLYGSTANTYTGTTRVNDGILEFNKSSGVNAMAGDLIVGNNAGTDTVRWLNNAQLPGATDVTVNNGALLDLDNHTEALGALTLNAGDVETVSGTLTLGGNVTAGGVDGIASIRGNLSLGTANRTFDILPDPDGSYPQIYIYATISGSGGIFKTGSGALSLAGTNTYSGITFVSDGALIVDASAALGDTAAGTTVGASGELHLRGNAQVGNESLTLTGLGLVTPSHYSLACFGGTSNSWAGPITLVNEVGISINRDTVLDLSGPIGGTGGFTTVGPGTLVLSGSQANTFSGDVRVDAGSLHLNKTITDGALPGPGSLTIGDDAGGAYADVVRLLHNAQIDGTVAITVNTSGEFILGDFSETIGALTLHSGYVRSADGILTLGGNVTATSTSSNISVIAGRLSLGSSTRTFDTPPGGVPPQLRLIAAVTGTGGIRKTGRGYLELRSTNTYSGLTTVAEGMLWVVGNTALGDTVQGTVVEDGATLGLGEDVHVGNEPLTLQGAGFLGFGAALLTLGSGSCSWTGPVTLAADTVIIAYTNSALNLAGAIGGTGGIAKGGDGTLILSGSRGNTYAGDTLVARGTLELDKTAGDAIRYGTLSIGDGVGGANADVVRLQANNQLYSTVPIAITNSGWLDLNGHDDIVGPLTFTAGRASSGASGLLRLGGNVTANYTASGRPSLEGNVLLYANRTLDIANSSGSPDLNLSAAVSGSAGFTKTGAGALGLYGSNVFDGVVTVNDGLVYLYHDAALGSTAGGTVVNDGGVLVLANGRAVGAEPLTLNGNGDGVSGALTSIGGSNSWAGTVTLATDSVITVQTNRQLNLAGIVAGPAGFTKAQPGTLILSGTSANTYAGNTIVNEGTLLLDKTPTDGALPGPGDLIIGDGGGGLEADVVRELRSYQIEETVDITLNDAGLLDLNDRSDTVGGLTIINGRITTGDGTLTLGGNVHAEALMTNSSYFPPQIRGHLALGAVTRTFDLTASGPDRRGALDIYAEISGLGGILKMGEGSLRLGGSNSYSGVTTVAQGGLDLADSHALGSTAAGTVVEDGAHVSVGFIDVDEEPLTLNGFGSGGFGALNTRYAAGSATSNSWAGPITLASDTQIDVRPSVGGNVLNLTGPISGPGGFTKTGQDTLILSGANANTFAGTTYVNQGILVLNKSVIDGAVPGNLTIGNGSGGAGADIVRLQHDNQIGNTADVTIASSGLFDLNGYYDRIDAITGSGSINLGSGHLVAGHSGSSFTFDGLVSGTGYLWKVGAGTWTLTGNNTYSGTTRIEAGTLLVNGAQPASDVLIQSLGTLGGTGSVGIVTSTGGVLSPGVSPGTLTSSNVLFDSATDFVVELTPAGADQLNARGKVGLGNASLLLSAPGLLPTEGQEFVIVNNDDTDAVTGTFAGLAEGARVSAGPRRFWITYRGGTGNDVALVATNTAALRPTLSIWRTATNSVVLSWPQSDIAWLLHATTNLAATPISWTENPPPYSSNATDCVVTEPATAGQKFYRLHKP